jgi:hypothetical protein
LTGFEIESDVPEQTFDRGELASLSWDGEFEFGNEDGALGGFDDLSIGVFSGEDLGGVLGSIIYASH